MSAAASAPAPALRVEGLVFGWPRGDWRLRVPALALAPGERVFLHGPSGTGKSTLLNLIAGTLVPQQGRVEVGGAPMSALPGHRRDRLRADRIGVLFQQFNLLPFLSPVENVLLPCRFSALRRERAVARFGSLEAAAATLLDHLGLGARAVGDRQAMALSVGQQQRVAAARAVIGGPDLVIADEPTSALDADARDDFLSLLFAECEAAGSALLFVSHDLALAARFARSESLARLTAPEAA
ncbi:ABC transporter ATP-binding protein [Coralloluteibacterium thermophilus]|uniref:ABC transporter ATP-binding protein n=1 Tax=Coralloluteibacterium thermophilum TaxID=2707049 RepID=A0ABV9NL74_9GAMM